MCVQLISLSLLIFLMRYEIYLIYLKINLKNIYFLFFTRFLNVYVKLNIKLFK